MEGYSDFDYSQFNNLGSGTDAGFLAALGIVFGIMMLICLAVAVIVIIAQWKMFKKGDQPGWAALIPIYNTYIQCKLVGVNPWWILIVFCAGILSVIPVIGSLLSFAVSVYFMILLAVSTARAFGKEDAFAIGLILLPVVFYPIIGFGSSEYKGDKNPMNDFVFKKGEEIVHNKKQPSEKYCASCGAGMTKDTKFCPKCGKEVK